MVAWFWKSTPLLEHSNTGDVYKIETPPPVLHVHVKGKTHCIFIILEFILSKQSMSMTTTCTGT